MKSEKCFSLMGALIIAGVLTTPVYGAISFKSAPRAQNPQISTYRYLNENNAALRRALDIHNLMNEVPDLLELIQSADDLEKHKAAFAQFQRASEKCTAKAFKEVFKDPDNAWTNMVNDYESKRQILAKQSENENALQTGKMRKKEKQKQENISQDIMKKVVQNPAQWGELLDKRTAGSKLSKETLDAAGRNLEESYNMRLAMDSYEKGGASLNNTVREVQQDLIQRITQLGIRIDGAELVQGQQFNQLQKMLRAEKKKAIADAREYIKLLEKQDNEHPELVQRRQKQQDQKKSRMSEAAQRALSQDDAIIQISQMSPVMRQKMVIAALEKDEDALAHLTETNAKDVDQLIREHQATDKLMKEARQQIKSSYTDYMNVIPEVVKCD